MKNRQVLKLRRHRLQHIPILKIDPVVFEEKFAHGCSMRNCDASCCREGVMVDVEEQKKILLHADVVRRHMELEQVHDPSGWFDAEEVPDSDFPSGWAIGTRATGQGCVFLKKDGRCVLQTAAEEENMSKFTLKPFFCFAFPVTIESAVLTIDDPEFANRPACCSMIPGGSRSVLEVCREELDFVLGAEGMSELSELAQEWSKG